MATKFRLGQITITPGALDAVEKTGEKPITFLRRHESGDWGDVNDADKQENDLSVTAGFRIVSAYHLNDGTKIYVITERDRSATTILLPDEY